MPISYCNKYLIIILLNNKEVHNLLGKSLLNTYFSYSPYRYEIDASTMSDLI